ncbi:MAG: DUF3127 domain-containing protein [Bacteroidia bacterium]|jgi:hypothetical protein|nr:DUF3127 domain-containing protein [Bacteroidia bacterium]
MEINGKIIQLLEKQTGQGKNGVWEKQDYILETEGQYPKKVCFNLWGDKINQFGIKVGDQLTVSFDIESREYNGRWYTDVRAWAVKKLGATAPASNGAPVEDLEFNPFTEGGDPFAAENTSGGDDLPF